MRHGSIAMSLAYRVFRRPILSHLCPHSTPTRVNQPSNIRRLQTARFSPFVPPDPSKLPKAKKPRKWVQRFVRFGVYSSVFSVTLYLVDTNFNDSCIVRSLRTFYTGLLIGFDYKINFRENPPLAKSIVHLHNRNAHRVFNLLRENGGLYLKIGQAIAMQSAILPPEFQKMFARMFDDAPQNEWKDVEKVIREEFGKSVEEVFGVSFTGEPGKGVMEKTARASASVAQVHWARLPDGREVAIKVQKKEIARQTSWDLWAFKVVARAYSYWFDLPVYTLVPYISERLQLETDFVNEANNSDEMKKYVNGERRLRGKVYIPEIYREFSSRRVMTAEWIEGVRLWDKDAITKPWYGGHGNGSPGAGATPLNPPKPTSRRSRSSQEISSGAFIKPERDEWRGRTGKGGLGVSLDSVMTIMIDLFSAQMFLWGLLHCDPHPGNIFIRRLPSGKPELVLIDHGLYIHMKPKFRHQYSRFWKALIQFDNETLKEVVTAWGVGNPDIFASATLMRPYTGGNQSTMRSLREDAADGKTEQQRAYEMQMKMRHNVKDILGNEDQWPKELIFIGRNLRIVQGNNQYLGSPVNRIKITGLWASRALADDPHLKLSERVRNLGSHMVFRLVLLGSDMVWWWSRIKQLMGRGKGMEDDMEAQMQKMARHLGVELQHDVFEG
ncbi:ABC1 domain protein [Eremomyces bilateralis CBS 781.70]|uniref:ABC1 domain protein n=1 Tax=Eremomyces bilateralis CBS 781.70 TaxID=1392243 RepID=A0A6G1FZ89_9PEZI|nr:ABC1 domain protein [Eremomyces bilateralis CBS 781.70]KAF1811032.1 ABC1 domain protein [Eremomyces bilateralis CBS 781.70]